MVGSQVWLKFWGLFFLSHFLFFKKYFFIYFKHASLCSVFDILLFETVVSCLCWCISTIISMYMPYTHIHRFQSTSMFVVNSVKAGCPPRVNCFASASCPRLLLIKEYLKFSSFMMTLNQSHRNVKFGEGNRNPLQYSCSLVWKISRMEEPGGLQSVGSHRVRHDWSDLAAAAAAAERFCSLLKFN